MGCCGLTKKEVGRLLDKTKLAILAADSSVEVERIIVGMRKRCGRNARRRFDSFILDDIDIQEKIK